MSTTPCAYAAMLTETRGVLHGAQIPEIPRVQADCLGWSMSPPDQLLYTALHGTAWRHAARQHNLADSIAELREIAMAVATSWPKPLGSPRDRGMPGLPHTLAMS